LKKDDTGVEDASALRRRAEELFRKRARKEPEELSVNEARSLLHELRVHQIELEMQNEELRRAQVEIEESRLKYSDLYDFAPVGYITMDRKGTVLEANLTACAKLEIERGFLIGKPFFSFIEREKANRFFNHIKTVFEEEARQTIELKLKSRKKKVFHALLNSIFWRGTGEQGLCRTSIIDITELKHAEEALKEAEEKYHSIFNEARDGIVLTRRAETVRNSEK
jgi:PAS domain S-box-containing protein